MNKRPPPVPPAPFQPQRIVGPTKKIPTTVSSVMQRKPWEAPAVYQPQALTKPAAAPVALGLGQSKSVLNTSCGCSHGGLAASSALQMKPAVLQAAKAKKQKANEKLYKQAARNWSNYACYETSTARQIERGFANLNAIYTFMVRHQLAGADSFPGHCSGGKGNKKNNGTKAVLDKIRTTFGF